MALAWLEHYVCVCVTQRLEVKHTMMQSEAGKHTICFYYVQNYSSVSREPQHVPNSLNIKNVKNLHACIICTGLNVNVKASID